MQDEDNEIMQFAIQQSLLESGGNKVSAGFCAWAKIVQQELKETSAGSVLLRPLEDQNNVFQRRNEGGLRVIFSG